MWILVLIFKLGDAGGITAIQDFPTEKVCIETGKQWETNTNTFGLQHYTYKCIKKITEK